MFPTYSPSSHSYFKVYGVSCYHVTHETKQFSLSKAGEKEKLEIFFITSPNGEIYHCTGFCLICLFFLATLPKPLSLVLIYSLETLTFAILYLLYDRHWIKQQGCFSISSFQSDFFSWYHTLLLLNQLAPTTKNFLLPSKEIKVTYL